MSYFYSMITCPECGTKGKFLIKDAFDCIHRDGYDIRIDDEKYGDMNPMFRSNGSTSTKDDIVINRGAKVYCSNCGHDCTDLFDIRNRRSYDRIIPDEVQ